MASQVQLQEQLTGLTAQLGALKAELTVATNNNETAQVASLQQQISIVNQGILSVQLEINNLTVSTPVNGPSATPGQTVPGSVLDPATGAYPAATVPSVNGKVEDARSAAATSNAFQLAERGDWRVRLSLAPKANYLYMADNPGILAPLRATNGIIFPYTPNIQVSYTANYDQTSIQHTNYKFVQYQNSAVENITVGCDFTAQDTGEANYVLAVIHFLRSVTKMFYGQDQNPRPGIPPPLCYLYGLGEFQFSGQPLVVTNFTYNLPTDVDYIRSNYAPDSGNPAGYGVQAPKSKLNPITGLAASINRLTQSSTVLAPGGVKPLAELDTSTYKPTYVPTKISIQITAMPVVARNDVSNRFSLTEYATGNLLLNNKGAFW